MRISSELPKVVGEALKVSKESLEIPKMDPKLLGTGEEKILRSMPIYRLPSISPMILALLEKELFAFGKLQMAYQRAKAYEREPIQKKMELQFQEMVKIVENHSIQENPVLGSSMMPWQEEMKQLQTMLFHGIMTKTENPTRQLDEASSPALQRMSQFFISFQRQDELSAKAKYILLVCLLGILILLLLW